MHSPELSIVIGVYNEEDGLHELHARLTAALQKLGRTYEIILVDDGSRDRSLQVMRELRQRDTAHLRIYGFTRNFGHHIALTAGLDHAAGDIVVMMDADLQDQPEELHKLLDKLDEGYDVVYGEREERQHSWYKQVGSKTFLWAMNKVIRSQVVMDSSIYRAMRRNVADDLRSMRERARYLPGMVRWTGYRQTSTPVTHGKRFAGTTKYSVWKLLKLGLSTATGFSAAPLQFATVIGMITAFLALLFLVYIVIRKLLGEYHVLGYASLMFAVSFFGALQLLVIGLMGEYVSRIYSEAQGRPLYLLNEIGEASKTAAIAIDSKPLASISETDSWKLRRMMLSDASLPLANVLKLGSAESLVEYYVNQWAHSNALLLQHSDGSQIVYQPLEWDTKVLGINSARILYAGMGGVDRDSAAAQKLSKALSEVIAFARANNVKLVDARVSNEKLFAMRAFEQAGFHMADMLVTMGVARHKMQSGIQHVAFERVATEWRFKNDVVVRSMRTEEAAELANLSERAFSDHSMIQDRFFLEPSIPVAKGSHLFKTWFENLARSHAEGRAEILVADIGGSASGYVALEKMPEIGGKTIWRDSLNAVSENARGRGVYKALIVAAIDHVQRENGDVLITKTQSSTYRVLNTWMHLGCDIYENFVTLHWVDENGS